MHECDRRQTDDATEKCVATERGLIDLIDYLFAQTCYKTAQVMSTEHEQDSQVPSALIAALIA